VPPVHIRHLPEGVQVEDGEFDDRSLRVLLAVVLGAAIIGGAIDLVMDAPDTWLSFHVMFELALIAGAMLSAYVLWRGWFRTRASLRETREILETQAADRDAWRVRAEHALAGLGGAIDEHLRRWGLTPAEREIALLLLKGYGHKRIAYDTGRSERTVRQHAVQVYQKSGLGGRAELAAFFLEDLKIPGSRLDGGQLPSR
jgi:DNA-binding CsgD family transcriptional regulator